MKRETKRNITSSRYTQAGLINLMTFSEGIHVGELKLAVTTISVMIDQGVALRVR